MKLYISNFLTFNNGSIVRNAAGIYLNTPSQGEVPFLDFSRAIYAFWLRGPFGQFTYPLSRYPWIYKKNSNNFAVKNVGGERLQ